MSLARLLLPCLLLLLGCSKKVVELVVSGPEHELRERPAGAPSSSPRRDPVLLIALDGVPRELLYDLVRRGELPSFAALLGDDPYLDDSLLATLPTNTMPAWVTTMTGVPPAEHGVTGNEYFIRETRTFACPAPLSFDSTEATLAIYTDRYLDTLVEVPTVFERMRETDPHVLIWVSMNHLFRGADVLLLAGRIVIAKALVGMLELPEGKTDVAREVFEALDTEAIETVVDRLGDEEVPPDVLVIYVSGTDLYAHISKDGPDATIRAYLREVVDPELAELVEALRSKGMLDRMWTVVTSDHGHTAVMHDDTHALGVHDPAARVLEAAGFRVRPFEREVDKRDPFSAVIAYGGAMAYVYLADRSRCPGAKDPCPWRLPPRYEEDVLAAADAFHRNNRGGSLAPAMKGTLDLVLVRRPRPFAQRDAPFEVYVGNRRTVPIAKYLAAHPRPTYVALAERLRDLAVGRYGERAGDVLLIAHNGDRARPEDRYYFASKYRSLHGSPSRDDSEIPLIVANHQFSAKHIGAHVRDLLGRRPRQQKVTDLLLAIRGGKLDP